MSYNFVCDKIVQGKAYPALAQHTAEPYTRAWQEFVQHWPYTVPCELYEHLNEFEVQYSLFTLDDFPSGSLYLIGLGFFDFTVDYFGLMDPRVLQAMKDRRLKTVFYYHEGDNPKRIRDYLNSLNSAYQLPLDSYVLVSGNTQAELLAGCEYFPDHELLYWRRNKQTAALSWHDSPRYKDFTVLSRTHKWWRATIVADLHRNQLLTNSYWSYNTRININQTLNDNGIEVDELNLRHYVEEFVRHGPYVCDHLSPDQHNDHSHVVAEHYQDSRCNIVLETHFNVDNNEGAFLTEKTFKPIKHAQPFVIAGGAGSLDILRKLGYRTFDSVMDNSYDIIYDDTERWRQLFRQIAKIKAQDPKEFMEQCRPDAEHNQRLFLSSKRDRLNNLLERIK